MTNYTHTNTTHKTYADKDRLTGIQTDCTSTHQYTDMYIHEHAYANTLVHTLRESGQLHVHMQHNTLYSHILSMSGCCKFAKLTPCLKLESTDMFKLKMGRYYAPQESRTTTHHTNTRHSHGHMCLHTSDNQGKKRVYLTSAFLVAPSQQPDAIE